MAFIERPGTVDGLTQELGDDGSVGVRGLLIHVSAEAGKHDIRFVVLQAAVIGAVHALIGMTEVHLTGKSVQVFRIHVSARTENRNASETVRNL